MGRTCSLLITDSTKPKHVDLFLNSVWGRYNEPVNLELNTMHCNNVSLRRILSMKKVLDHHRPNSRKYVESSTIIVGSQFARRVFKLDYSLSDRRDLCLLRSFKIFYSRRDTGINTFTKADPSRRGVVVPYMTIKYGPVKFTHIKDIRL